MRKFSLQNLKTKEVIRINPDIDYENNLFSNDNCRPNFPQNSLAFLKTTSIDTPLIQNHLNNFDYTNCELIDVIQSLNVPIKKRITYHQVRQALPQYEIYTLNIMNTARSNLLLGVEKLTDTKEPITKDNGVIIVPKDTPFDVDHYMKHLIDWNNHTISNVERWIPDQHHDYQYDKTIGFIYNSDDNFTNEHNLENAVKTLFQYKLINDPNVSHWRSVYASKIIITELKEY